MNRALLFDLQRRQMYPSVTVLMNTTPGVPLDATEIAMARRLIDHVCQRLDGDVADDLRTDLVGRLVELAEGQVGEPAGYALALCVSPEYNAAVRLGVRVEERVVIDDSFATRDLVADLNRTARYRVVTVSDRTTRLLLGDRTRLVEVRTEVWPMQRGGRSRTSWARDVARNLGEEDSLLPLPTVLAGVDRTLRSTIAPGLFDTIGLIPGNHDRTSWTDLHNAAWPLVSDWLRADGQRAIDLLGQARSTGRFAAGIDEIWSLARVGRVETLVVEEGFALAVRITNGRIEPAGDRESPDVVDDVVDDVIEAVLRYNGKAVLVPNGELHAHERVAAVLRY
jgi:Bacterial archaeo-eukaryotic release factor family 3